MRKELDDALCAKYPEIFRDRCNRASPMWYGFRHGDGWYHLIDALCETLSKKAYAAARHLESTIASDAGEVERAAALQALNDAQNAVPVASTIKEKFGALRVYLKNADAHAQAAVAAVVAVSLRTCELCGRPGSERKSDTGYLSTECDACWAMTLTSREARYMRNAPAVDGWRPLRDVIREELLVRGWSTTSTGEDADMTRHFPGTSFAMDLVEAVRWQIRLDDLTAQATAATTDTSALARESNATRAALNETLSSSAETGDSPIKADGAAERAGETTDVK